MQRYNPPGFYAIGSRWDLVVTVTKDGAPLDLTGATITAMIQSGATGHEVTVQPATAITLADQTTTTGQLTATFLPSETARMQPGAVGYEVRVSFDANNTDVPAKGIINAVRTVL